MERVALIYNNGIPESGEFAFDYDANIKLNFCMILLSLPAVALITVF